MMAATAQSLAYNLIFDPKSELHLLDEETILFLALRSERSLIYSLCSMNVSESHETCREHVRVTFLKDFSLICMQSIILISFFDSGVLL